MKKLKIKKTLDNKPIGGKVRKYIDFIILACCLIIAFNIHPSNISDDNNEIEQTKMIYIFHDYEGNEYIMNDNIHGASTSWDYLFNEEIPDELKSENVHNANTISIGDLMKESDDEVGYDDDISDSVKDNQISIGDIMSDLGIDGQDSNDLDDNIEEDNIEENNSNEDVSESEVDENNSYYTVTEEVSEDNESSLIIEKTTTESSTNRNEDDTLLPAKAFSFIEDGRVLPVLVSRDELYYQSNDKVISYADNSGIHSNSDDNVQKPGIIIIDEYEDCMTPWGYKIQHGDSVLAYQQIDNTPDICNIERRFCWKGKLSGTYTQQGCSISKGYTYEQWGENTITKETDDSNWSTKQNLDGSVSVKNSQIGGSDVWDRPNNTSSDFYGSENIRNENEEVDQTERPYWSCTTPWGEKVKHGQFVQAFKHSNGFSDSPCEAQIRLCSMGELMGTYTQSSCKTRDTSFIDWINGSLTRKTYSKEKIERVKKQIKNEEIYYKNTRNEYERSTNSAALDRILAVLDQD